MVENGQKRLKVGHFFLAIDIQGFLPLSNFEKTAGDIMRGLRSAKKEPGQDKIYTAGEKEYLAEIERKKSGIPLNLSLQSDIKMMKNDLNLTQYDFSF